MGGSRYSKEDRIKAVEAYNWEHGDKGKATQRMALWCPDLCSVHTYDQMFHFVEYWATVFSRTGTVESAPPPGQQPSMPDETAQACLDLLLRGFYKGRGHHFYRSISHALHKSQDLRDLCKGYYEGEHAHRCLLRRLRRLDPTLTRHTLRHIHGLTNAAMEKRLAYCQDLLALGEDQLNKHLARIVWVDAKKMYVCPEDHLVYAPHGATKDGSLLVYDKRLSKSQYDVKKIVYYAGVNAVLGACHFKICTGTTKYKALCKEWPEMGWRTYKVGVAWVPASNLYERVQNTKLQLGFAFTACTPCCTRLPHCLSSS
jgi:hypothetical protein